MAERNVAGALLDPTPRAWHGPADSPTIPANQMRNGPNNSAGPGQVHQGWNPGIVAGLFVALFIASLVPVTLIVSDEHFPSPLEPPGTIIEYFESGLAMVRLCATLQFASAVVFGILVGLFFGRLWKHGSNPATVAIALFAGWTTAVSIALSALIQWTLTQPGVADRASTTLSLYHLLVVIGGTGFSVPFGLFVAALSSIAAARRLLPIWLVRSGIVIGIIGELSIISLLIPNALHLVPLTRFPGFAWIILAGFKLPNQRPEEL